MLKTPRSLTIGFGAIVALGVAFVIGAFAVGPTLTKAKDGYLPAAVLNMPVGILPATNAAGDRVLLKVRIAETAEARNAGLAHVGPKALDTTVLLYSYPKLQTSRITYKMSGIRAPVELAILDDLGDVLTIKKVTPDASSVAVSEKHRWVLVAKENLLGKLGIMTGANVSPNEIIKIS